MKALVFLLLPVVQAVIRGYSFYGYETEQRLPVCSDVNPPLYYLSYLKDLGFNYIRVPFSTVFVEEGNFENMDSFMADCYNLKLSVLLDHHRTFPDRQDESLLDRGMTMERFMSAWHTIIDRYVGYENFVGLNAWNEFVSHNASFVNEVSEIVFTNIEKRYPNRFTYYCTGVLWSGRLTGVNIDHLPFKDRIRYSLHKYVFSIGANEDYEQSWNASLGDHEVSRVVIGEYGWLPHDSWWAEMFIKWLKKVGITDTFFWTIARSQGTGGLFQDDCVTFNADKYRLLRRLWGDKKYLKRNATFKV